MDLHRKCAQLKHIYTYLSELIIINFLLLFLVESILKIEKQKIEAKNIYIQMDIIKNAFTSYKI